MGDDEECQAPAAWRRRAAAGAVAGAIGLGLREALIPGPGEPEVVEVRDIESEPASQIDLYFHPQVPEATLVVVRRRQ